MSNDKPREMTGAELKSMLKSSINLKSLGGMKCEELNLDSEDLKWWRDSKIGMFIHWGLYSILGRGEWVKFNEQLSEDEYEALKDEFDPKEFNMHELISLAKDFGAKYTVMVSRHHDGFALWDSPGSFGDYTSFKSASKRDFVREYVEACRQENMKVGLYYSPMDWRFPGYFKPKELADNALLMKNQCYNQVEELCRDYGPLDILWYDGGWLAHKGSDTSSAWFWEPIKLNKLARKYNPKMLINPRSGWEGDFYCDEGSHEISGNILPVPWEKNMCVCSGSSWGWMPDDPVSTFDWLIKMMINVVCRDGNWLLNVGPDKNGKLSKEVTDRMREIGDWLSKYGDSVYSTRGGPLQPLDEVYGTTYKDNIVYVHILDLEAFSKISLPGIKQKIIDCKTYDGSKCSYNQDESKIKINLPKGLPKAPDTIIKLKLDKSIVEKEKPRIHFKSK